MLTFCPFCGNKLAVDLSLQEYHSGKQFVINCKICLTKFKVEMVVKKET